MRWQALLARRGALPALLAGCLVSLWLSLGFGLFGVLRAQRGRLEGLARKRGNSKLAAQMLRVMSFNVRYDNSDDRRRGRGWTQRCDAVARVIAEHGADLVGTQEAFASQLDNLKKALAALNASYLCSGSPRDLFLGIFPCDEHCAILSRADSVDCLQVGTFCLSETPERLGSKSWGSACPRIATYGWYRMQGQPDKCMLLLNTHLDHMSEEARIQGSRLIVRRLDDLERQGPPEGCTWRGTIVTGDFNSLLSGPAFAVFAEAGFQDSCSEGSAQAVPFSTYHGWRDSAAQKQICVPARAAQNGATHGHIDWVLWRGSGIRLLHFRVITDTSSEVPPSDHFPILAEFEILS